MISDRKEPKYKINQLNFDRVNLIFRGINYHFNNKCIGCRKLTVPKKTVEHMVPYFLWDGNN